MRAGGERESRKEKEEKERGGERAKEKTKGSP